MAAARAATRWLLALALLPAAARADDDGGTDYKLTFGRYASSDGNPALDLNLRASRGAQTGWIAVYQDRAGLRQWRAGYERHFDGERLRSVLSLQNASGGAWVFAASAEVGGASYAIAGWGRTDLRNYINLNYDPNDAVTFGVGTRALRDTELSLFQVRDDRLHTGQQVTHGVLRRRFEAERFTVDLYTKRGRDSDGVAVRTASWSLGWDHAMLFVRYAHDPRAGFAGPTQDRLSFGTRF